MSVDGHPFNQLAGEWSEVCARQVRDWDTTLEQMIADEAALMAGRRWRSGPATLLEMLGLNRNEVVMVRTLSWLLKPGMQHGLGDLVVARLLESLGVPYTHGIPIDVRREERQDSGAGWVAADLLLRTAGQCILIEAKIDAVESTRQCELLADLWAHESPTLVFITPNRRAPASAGGSRDRWGPMSWSDIADIVTDAVHAASVPCPNATPGCAADQAAAVVGGVSVAALDFMHTLAGLRQLEKEQREYTARRPDPLLLA
ncbi:PD-(D/E)XK nuclease family protein [Micromonospora sp. NPDC047557]|uniref:PD-(D/E)XK nuclease family protein n=1 Tax=Micromonospora sp. NPDC047557 TaxID=3364250 RepID=UPI0037130849